ncbi:MAG: CHASE2 domain-containing protein, partial [Phormidesmis sp. CAN_BIN44]|nr:CHASE2 domain-containing protein [Phormidesmis sp. CAN_BIN44]
MSMLVILKLNGDLAQGFHVILTIGAEGKSPDVEAQGFLPPASRLIQALGTWQDSYRKWGGKGRIKNIKVDLGGSLNSQKAECKEQAATLEDHLNTWLNEPSFVEIQKTWLRKIQPQASVRVIIQSNDRQVAALPWHLWQLWKDYCDLEIGFSSLHYERKPQIPQLDQFKPMQILAILGDSEGIDVEYDRQQLSQIPNANVTFLVEPKRQEVTDQLCRSQAWDILFFAGHSKTQAEKGLIYINSNDSFALEELRGTLNRAIVQGLQLAIFNSCDCLGLAWELEQLKIPQVIVMRERVPDRVAQEFLKAFLQAFSQGKPLYSAVRQARERLEGIQDEFPCATWLPTIWQNPAIAPLIWRAAPVREVWFSWRRLGMVAVASVAIATSVMGLRVMGGLLPTELWAFDQLMRLRPDEPVDPNLLVVEMTQGDADRYNHPLPGKVFTQLLRKLDAAKPSVIGIDIFRSSPQEPGHAELVEYLKQSKSAIALCERAQEGTDGIAPPAQVPIERVGFSDVVQDQDRVLRRHLLSMKAPSPKSLCQAEGALSLVVALKYFWNKGIQSEPTSDGYLQLGRFELRPTDLEEIGYPDPEGHQILLNYRRTLGTVEKMAERVSMSDVLQGRVSPQQVKGRIVLIGVTDKSSVKDEFQTPYGEETRGLMIHAQMVSQLVNAAEGRRSLLWTFGWIESFGWILGWALIGGALGWRVRSNFVLIICVMGAIVILVGGSFVILLW